MTLDSRTPSGPLADKWDRHKFDIKLVNPANKRKFTVIVVGTGLAGASAAASLGELGYHVRWESWVLQLPEGAAVPRRDLPEGYTVRAAEPDDYRAAWTVQEDAFLEWSDRDRQSYEDWESSLTRRPGFEPWNLRAAHVSCNSARGNRAPKPQLRTSRNW